MNKVAPKIFLLKNKIFKNTPELKKILKKPGNLRYNMINILDFINR